MPAFAPTYGQTYTPTYNSRYDPRDDPRFALAYNPAYDPAHPRAHSLAYNQPYDPVYTPRLDHSTETAMRELGLVHAHCNGCGAEIISRDTTFLRTTFETDFFCVACCKARLRHRREAMPPKGYDSADGTDGSNNRSEDSESEGGVRDSFKRMIRRLAGHCHHHDEESGEDRRRRRRLRRRHDESDVPVASVEESDVPLVAEGGEEEDLDRASITAIMEAPEDGEETPQDPERLEPLEPHQCSYCTSVKPLPAIPTIRETTPTPEPEDYAVAEGNNVPVQTEGYLTVPHNDRSMYGRNGRRRRSRSRSRGVFGTEVWRMFYDENGMFTMTEVPESELSVLPPRVEEPVPEAPVAVTGSDDWDEAYYDWVEPRNSRYLG